MSWVDVENKLSRIERISRSGKKVENLAYLLNKDMLRQCYKELKPDKAAGIDKVTKKQYGMNLDQNLTRLVSKLKGGTYFPRPSRRIYIPKPGTNKKRPLGISCFEDKIVERALNKILVAVYEPRFLDCSYGFRPKRNCHQAISKVLKSINGLTSYVVEADIRNCFGSFNHDILIEALELSIADRRFIEIIRRGLKAGHLEDNIYIDDLTGTAQGSGCSPTLANVYMHHVLDQWFKVKVSSRYYRGRKFRGQAVLVRYADDFVATFRYKDDAWSFYRELKERLEKYGLSLAEEKTRVIEFGRFAQDNINQKKARGAKGRSKPETFDFLGFTFYCSTSWKDPGKFCPKVKSIGKRMSRKIKQITSWIKYNRYLPVRNIVAHLHDVLRGYFNYYAVTCNSRCVKNFRYEVVKSLFKWLNRRSQRRSYTWKGFNQMMRTHKLDDAHIRVKIYELCV
jgi:group II intron reverse transcriptase/maturase